MSRLLLRRLNTHQVSGRLPLSQKALRFQPRQVATYFTPLRGRRQTLRNWDYKQASYTSYGLYFIIVCGSAILFDCYTQSTTLDLPPDPPTEVVPLDENENTPIYSMMATPPGHLGNLTPEQEQKLLDLWMVTLKTFGVQDQDPSHPKVNGALLTANETPSASDNEAPKTTPKKHTKRLSIFSRKHDDSDATASPPRNSTDEDDKYGQTAQLRQILATQTPESLRVTLWSMVKSDHPDSLLLRFLRARKWDVDRALAMMISTVHWRGHEMHVDEDVMLQGEGGAKLDEASADAYQKKEGRDFLTQLRMGKSFLYGVDKDGRPMTYVRARLHKGGEQTERSLERYTVYTIEMARLALVPPVETACIVFDMTSFTMANMDYTPVKFMIKIFEANYPESLGAILVHKAPWIFQGIWKIIRGWLDPVVASKVHFTNTVEDMEAFVPKSQIIKELGGSLDWEYKYIEPVEGENDLMKDTTTRDQLLKERDAIVLAYQQNTFDWHAGGANTSQAKAERKELANKLNQSYWKLDPYIRARSIYDRIGYIGPGGKTNFSPTNTLKTNGSGPPKQQVAEDDVD